MIIHFTRQRLLGSAALGLLGAFTAAAPASAQCVVGANSVTCATTATLDSTHPVNAPNARHYTNIDTSAGNFTGTVNSGAAVTGNGLAFTNTVGGNALNVVNSGIVQVDLGNAPSAGGTAALNINPTGTTSVNYSGTGDILNLGTGNGLEIVSVGTGNLSAIVGGSVTSTTGTGIELYNFGTAGTNVVTTSTGEVIRANYAGIDAQNINAGNAGSVTVTNAATIGSVTGSPGTLDYGIFSYTTGTGAATLTNSGAIGSATDRLVEVGLYGGVVNATSAANLTVSNGAGSVYADTAIYAVNTGAGQNNVSTGTGLVNGLAFGINADTFGIGSTSIITGTGAVTASDPLGVGIDVSGGGIGNATVTTGGTTTGGDAGIRVATTGTQTITVNGVTTGTATSGIHSDTTGTRTITVGTAGNVTGGAEAILLTNTGGASIVNSGIIGGAATGQAIDAATATAPVIVTNNASGTINGSFVLGSGNDALNNAGTFNTQGTLDFGLGTDSLNNTGTITLTGATILTGLETLNNSTGRINLGTFTLAGSGAFTNGAGGTVDTAGNASLLGFTSLSNAGTLDLAAGTFLAPVGPFTNSGTILADEGATTISGQTSFTNTGTIDLQDGVTGDFLTINSSFAGSGGSNLLIDFDSTTSDRLIIGGAASGTTVVNANRIGSGLFDIDGLLVVDTLSTTANAFVLGTVTGNTSPLVDYALVQAGSDFFLTAAPNQAAFNPLAVPGFALDLWHQSANEVFAETVKPASTVGLSFWGNVYLSRDKYGDNDDTVTLDGVEFDVDTRMKTKRRGIQLGVDYGFDGGRLGLTGGLARAKADNDAGADLTAKGFNLGLYGQFGGLTGFHGAFLAKHDRYNGEFDAGVFDGEEFDIRSNGIDGSVGYRFGMSEAATFGIHAGLSSVRTKVDDINAFGLDYDIGNLRSTRGRLGARAIFGPGLSPYVDATVYREFSGDRDVELFDGGETYDLGNSGKGTWMRIEAGLSGNNGPGPILAAWGDFGDRKGLGLRAGFRFGGARVIEAVSPPVEVAPPAPPAPATQTCSDGSVILASDMCPPAPEPYVPPAPPAPAPERG